MDVRDVLQYHRGAFLAGGRHPEGPGSDEPVEDSLLERDVVDARQRNVPTGPWGRRTPLRVTRRSSVNV